jgi:hypothetical protein
MNIPIKVKVTYKGKEISEKFLSEHPEIHTLYPSREFFMKSLYMPLLEKVKELNTVQILEITENGIFINEILQNSKFESSDWKIR